MNTTKAVVIGGGSGAPVSIRTLLDMGCSVSSVVAMVDDGGSTGKLRELGQVVPPGDVRKCILAMSSNPEGIFARAFRHRFDYLDNHSLGNLILTAFAEETNSFPDAIEISERMVEARGHVYPSTLHDITLEGTTRDGRQLQGQAAITDSECAMETVTLPEKSIQPYPPALEAIREANLIVLGPGSLFTSIIPNLLVPGVIDAIKTARSRRDNPACTMFVTSLADMQGETWGMNCADHVDALLRHGMDGLLDIALIHENSPESPMATGQIPLIEEDYSDARFQTRGRRGGLVRHVEVTPELLERIRAAGVEPMARDLVDEERPTWHDQERLQEAFEEVLQACRLRRK
ncbi:MAG: YvcK family protein [Coriobacteriaceae bacterium]|nr:YvcK family protein [Coriobacteriaceae bacterium]